MNASVYCALLVIFYSQYCKESQCFRGIMCLVSNTDDMYSLFFSDVTPESCKLQAEYQ